MYTAGGVLKEGSYGSPQRFYRRSQANNARPLRQARSLGCKLERAHRMAHSKRDRVQQLVSVSPKYGWSLRPLLKKRTILWMGPCQDCFRVSFALGDKAVAAARASELPKALLEEIASARRYAEGTPVRLIIKSADDLAPVRTLVEIKLQN